MKKVKLKPKANVEEYLNNDFNIMLYNELNQCNSERKKLKKDILFEPLFLFNLLYQQLEIVKANKAKPLSVAKHLINLKLLKEHNWYFFSMYLNALIRKSSIDDKQLSICSKFINIAINEKGKKGFKEKKIKPAIPQNIWSIGSVKKRLELMHDVKSKMIYLLEELRDYRQRVAEWGIGKPSFEKQVKLELETLRAITKLKVNSISLDGLTEKDKKINFQYTIYAFKHILDGQQIKKGKDGNAETLASNYELNDGITLYNRYHEIKREIIRSKYPLSNRQKSLTLLESVLPKLETSTAKEEANKLINDLKSSISSTKETE